MGSIRNALHGRAAVGEYGLLKLEFGPQELCMGLLRADTEEEVISILQQQGYWDDPAVWVPFGGKDNNYSTMGNQTSRPEAALVEKLVNSVDAVLMGECRQAGVRPDSPEAPQTIPEAVAEFFAGARSKADTMGDVARWDNRKRKEVADRITLAATGGRQNVSFTIADSGEGQSPNSMPETLLSLDQGNKVNVQFVQGKFNMGGTGALRFCGVHNLQLIVSRRNPSTPDNQLGDASIEQWGFAIVRRENPTGQRKISRYTYLAPLPEGVLRFQADTLPLLPVRNKPYARATAWGTTIKLYEYQMTGKSHILRKDGLLQKLDLLLPRPALPIRLHECRDYGGGPASFDTNLNGVTVRLNDDRRENLEVGFPLSNPITIQGHQLPTSIYAFKRGKADNYKNAEGILFTVNGQTHGSLPQHFFGRKAVGLDRLRDSLLVIVDCTGLSGRLREDLFMNSRDRMEEGELLSDIEDELETSLRTHQGLRDLRLQRQQEDAVAKLRDSKPFRETLEAIMRKSPTIAHLFGGSGPLPNPFRPQDVQEAKPYQGKPYPTVFRFQDLDYGKKLVRTTPRNMRSRIPFTTDVVNDYFVRTDLPGSYTLRPADQGSYERKVPNNSLNLNNGIATLNLKLPDGATEGQAFAYELVVEDATRVFPFANRFTVTVGPPQAPNPHRHVPPPPPNEPDSGNGTAPSGLRIPHPIPVVKPDWPKHAFDEFSALKVVHNPSEDSGLGGGDYSYYINMDNIYLQSELKASRGNPELIKARWEFGMMLVALALLRPEGVDRDMATSGATNGESEFAIPQDDVHKITRAIAPVLLPLIEHLGALSDEDIAAAD